jgi:hypothetical protein
MKVKSTTISFLALLVLVACASTTVEARTFQSSSSLAASLTKKALPLENDLLKLQQQQQQTTASSTSNADLIKELTVRGGDDAPIDGLVHRLKIGGYFAAWYALNVVYNSKFTLLRTCSQYSRYMDAKCRPLYLFFSS